MNKQAEDIKVIREMMERSSKFLSLSGLSGVTAGLAALIGGAMAWYKYDSANLSYSPDSWNGDVIAWLLMDGLLVLLISIGGGVYFSFRKTRKQNLKLSVPVIKKTLYTMGVPLLAGGILAVFFLFQEEVLMALAVTLIFYGLSLAGVSHYTYNELHSLGLVELVLGLTAIFLPSCAFLLWMLGFGLCHILYGMVMYLKYEKRRA